MSWLRLSNILPTEQKESDAQSELAEYLYTSQQRRKVFPRAALVGLLSGLTAAVFRYLLTLGDSVRNGLITWSHQFPILGWIFPALFGLIGAVGSVFLVRRFAPEAAGSGIPHLESVLHRYRNLDASRVIPVKFFGGILALGSGLALGREGPSVQIGGAVADAVARFLKTSTRDRLTLIAAGAGAGLSAAFNAPLAGVIFVLEEVQRDFRPIVLGAAFVSAVIANIVARLLLGQMPSFEVPNYPVPPLSALPIFVIVGIVAGVLGVAFNRGLVFTQTLFANFAARTRSPWIAVAVTGAVIGLVGWFAPVGIGGGHQLAEIALLAQFGLAVIPLWFVLRFVLTLTSYATGAPGGIFAPLLALGALLGLAIGLIAHAIAPDIAPQAGAFAVVGMAAYFTAIVRAPLTGIVLILEMTTNLDQMLPLAVACFTAYAVAELMGELPIYETLLARDLMKGGIHPHPTQAPLIVEVEIEPDSAFAGREVRELGLPQGCLLVRCQEGDVEFVPVATTRLWPHMQVTATIAPDSPDGLLALRRGCEAMG